jgi:hypothetical protein
VQYETLDASATSPLELMLSARHTGQTGGDVHTGVAVGVLPGVGTPAVRVVVGVGARHVPPQVGL